MSIKKLTVKSLLAIGALSIILCFSIPSSLQSPVHHKAKMDDNSGSACLSLGFFNIKLEDIHHNYEDLISYEEAKEHFKDRLVPCEDAEKNLIHNKIFDFLFPRFGATSYFPVRTKAEAANNPNSQS